MRKVIQIDGGIGRVISSTAAIRDLYKRTGIKPTIITGYPEVFWQNPNIYKIYRMDREYLWDDVIRHGDFCMPEPYHDILYYTQQHHLSQSFDRLLGGKGDFGFPELFLTPQELEFGKNLVNHIRDRFNPKSVIAFQPFGAGAFLENGEVIDRTHRSLSIGRVSRIVNEDLSDIFINCSSIPLNFGNVWQQNFNLRELMSVVAACDFIVCIDSCLSHIGAAFYKTGLLILGPTFAQNVGYPNYEMPSRDGYPKSYYPNRFSGFVDDNEEAMDFDIRDMNDLVEIIRDRKFPKNFAEAMEKSKELMKERALRPYIPEENTCLYRYTEDGKTEEVEEVKREPSTPIPFPGIAPTPECTMAKTQELPDDPAKAPTAVKIKKNLDTMF